jgi:hypothetical protein
MNQNPTSDEIIEEFLNDLRHALQSVSPNTAKQFVTEIQQHIAEGRTTLEPGDQVGLRNLLERIGSPTLLASEIAETESPRIVSAMDRATPWLIALGGFAFGFGWLIGLYGLWSSKTWRIWDKLLGTFIWPGGLLGTFYLFAASSIATTCSGSTRPGQTNATMTCVNQGLFVAFPHVFQFLVGFVVVAAPMFTAFRLGSILTRGYADASKAHGIRVAQSGRSKTSTRVVSVFIGLMSLIFMFYVLSLS